MHICTAHRLQSRQHPRQPGADLLNPCSVVYPIQPQARLLQLFSSYNIYIYIYIAFGTNSLFICSFWNKLFQQTCDSLKVHVLLQNHAMSHAQLLRAIFHALADPKTFTQGLFMQWEEGQGSKVATAPPQQAMRKAFEVAFVDSSGWCNMAAHMSKSSLKQARFHPTIEQTMRPCSHQAVFLCHPMQL